MSDREWYAEGLRFECTQCGACCTGGEGYVLVSDEEADAIAARLKMDRGAFLRKYTHKTPAGRSLKEHKTEFGLDCVFLDRATFPGRAVCSLYDVRPMQCRTFPWWPENLRSRAAWERAACGCEGIGRGGFVPIEAIRVERDTQASYDSGRNTAASR